MTNERLHNFRFARRVRGANRAAQILLGLSLVIALNFLAANYFQRFDLTESGAYSLAPESKGYLRELDNPVDIIVTIPEDSESAELEQIHRDLEKLLREYEFAARRDGKSYIDVEFVDIHRQRGRARQLANQYDLTRENIILVTSGDRSREIRQAELYEVSDGKIQGFRGEKVFTSAILDVASEKAEKIYFLVGHGEMRLDDVDPTRGLSQLENFLRERNFELGTIDLSVDEAVPEDADLVVVPSPQAGLLPAEVEKLRRYMSDRNGKMIVFLDPGRRHRMQELFYDWGIMTNDMLVIDEGDDYRARGGDLIIRRFAEHPITEMLIEYQITALFGQPRPVRTDPAVLDDERLKVEQLIATSEESWATPDYRQKRPEEYDPARDIKGPVPIAAVSTRSAGSDLGITIPGGRMAVFGNSDFIANNRFRAFGNRSLVLNTINWTLNRMNLLNIPSRPLESYQIVMSEGNLKSLLGYFAILPGAIALFGLFVFLIRRR